MIAQSYIISGETKDILDAEDVGAEEVGLQRDAVAVPAGHLQNWLQPPLFEKATASQGTQSHHRALLVSHVHGIDSPREACSILLHAADVHALWRSDLACHHELAADQFFSEVHFSRFPPVSR